MTTTAPAAVPPASADPDYEVGEEQRKDLRNAIDTLRTHWTQTGKLVSVMIAAAQALDSEVSEKYAEADEALTTWIDSDATMIAVVKDWHRREHMEGWAVCSHEICRGAVEAEA